MRNSRKALAEAGRGFDEALKAREHARARLLTCISDARRCGTSIAEISRLAGVTRQTVYSMLEEAKAD